MHVSKKGSHEGSLASSWSECGILSVWESGWQCGQLQWEGENYASVEIDCSTGIACFSEETLPDRSPGVCLFRASPDERNQSGSSQQTPAMWQWDVNDMLCITMRQNNCSTKYKTARFTSEKILWLTRKSCVTERWHISMGGCAQATNHTLSIL